MKHLSFFMAIALVAILTGCASVDVVKPNNLNGCQLGVNGTTKAHIQANNWGLYLFMIPLLTGSTEQPGTILFLQDTVTVDKVVNMVTKKSKDIGASGTYDMMTTHKCMPWFFGFKEVSVSANAIR